MSHVAVDPMPDSRLVNVVVTHRDPKEAALWANTLGEVYIEQSLSSRVESARKAYEWLQERLTVTQKSMREAQDRLFKSYQSQDLFVPEGSVSAVTSSITKLGDDLVEMQGRRIALEAALKQIEQARGSRQSLETVPQVAADSLSLSLSGQLSTLQLELSRLKEKFKDAHPEVQKVQAPDRPGAEGAGRARAPDRGRPAGGAARSCASRRRRSARRSTCRRPRPRATAARARSWTRCARSPSPPRTSTRSCSRS